MPCSRFQSKIVVVSGGADGVGRAAALMFAREGARVAILDILDEKGAEVVQATREAGGEARFFHTDVSHQDQVRAGIAGSMDAFGQINILFKHAGTVIVKPFLKITIEDWNRLMAINVASMVHACQATIPHMLKQGGGAIVNTCSVSGLTASALEAAYCVSKGACIQLTRAIAVEFRDRNIRCNGVCPALIRTAHGMRESEELIAHGESWSEKDVAKMQG